MANFEEIVIGIGLESKDFSTKIQALSRQYDSFIKVVSNKPIDIKFSDEGVKSLQKSLAQAQQNLAKFASDIKQKFQLEFNPNIVNLEQIKTAVTNKIADLQSQLDRSPLRVNIDPKIFSDAARLLSALESIRKKEASGAAAGPQEQERVASLLSKLQGLDRIFNKGFFDKFNQDSTTTGQKIDLLKTKLEQLSQLKGAQDRPNPALQNLIEQLAQLEKSFFSAQSVLPTLRGLKEQVEGLFAQLNLLQSTQGVPQEVITSFSELAKTLHSLSGAESERKEKALTSRKEENEIDLRFTLATEEDKLRAKEASLIKGEEIDQKEVVSTVAAETAKTAAVQSGAEARSTATKVEQVSLESLEKTLGDLVLLNTRLKTSLAAAESTSGFSILTTQLETLKKSVSDPTIIPRIEGILGILQKFKQESAGFDPAKVNESEKSATIETFHAIQAETDALNELIAVKRTEVDAAKRAETAKTNAVQEGVAARTEITKKGISVETQVTAEGVQTVISKIGKIALEFSGGSFAKPLEEIGRVSKDLTSSIDENILRAEDFIRRLGGLTVPPNSQFSDKKLQENLLLQQALKKAYEDTVAAVSKLKDVESLRDQARGLRLEALDAKAGGDSVEQAALGQASILLSNEADTIERDFKLATAKLTELHTQATTAQNKILQAENTANDKKFNDTQEVDAKLRVLAEERLANETLAIKERERVARASLFSVNDAEEVAIQKILRGREILNAKLLKLEEILKEQRIAIQNSPTGLGAGDRRLFASRIQNVTEEIRRAKTEIAAFTREEQKAVDTGGFLRRIFSGFSKNIFESIGAVIKFNTAWRLTGFIIEAALSPFTLFIDSIKDGFTFLVNLQQKVADVRELLVQNVTFAETLADNFELAGQAAQFLAVEQERSAAQIGVAADKFRNVFESFTATGGIKAVTRDIDNTEASLTRATRTTALLVAALNAVGVGSENTRRQTTEIGKLLEGQVKQQDRIRIASGLSKEELNKRSLEAQKEGKFLEFVEDLFGAQVKRLETANDRFKELNTQVEFFLNRLKAVLVEPAFEKVISFLKQVLKFLKDNEQQLNRIAKVGAHVFLALISLLKEILLLFGSIAKAVFDATKALLGFSDVTDHATRSFDELTDVEKLTEFEESLLVLHRILVAIANVVDLTRVAFVQLRMAARQVVEDPTGVKQSIASLSPQVDDFFRSIDAFDQAEDKFVEHRKKLKENEDLLRTDILDFAQKRDESGANKAREKLKDNLAEQASAEKDFSQKQKEFAEKRLIATHISNELAIQMEDVDLRKRVKARIDGHEALKAQLEKENKELPKILGFPDREHDSGKTKFNNDRLDALKEAFKDEIELFTQSAEEFIAIQEKFEKLGILSEKNTTENIKIALDQRTVELEDAKKRFIAISKTLTEADPSNIAKFQSQVRRQVSDLESKASKKKTEEDEKQGELELKLRDRRDEDERKQVISQTEFLLQLEKQAAEVGLKLKSETFDREIELEELKLDDELRLLSKELANKAESEERKQEINQKAIKAVKDFNHRIALLNLERIKETFAQEEKVRETRLAQFKIAQDQFQQLAGIGGELAGTESEKFIQQQIDLESKRLVIQEELLENETKLTKVKEEQVAFEKEFADIGAKVAAGTASQDQIKVLENSKTLLNAQSDLYRQIKLRIDEINNSLELQNLIIAKSQAEERARKRFGFQLGRSFFGDLPSSRLESVPIPVARPTLGGLPNVDGSTVELVRSFKAVIVEARPLSEIFKKLKAGGKDTAGALLAFGEKVSIVLNGITSAINAFQEGTAQGIASVLSTAAELDPEPISKAVLSIASAVIGGISAIFTALARRLAEQISKSIDHILHDFERGFATLGDTIVRLERERLEAISKLSGKKGGQKELDKILPDLEDKIEDLIKQQRDIQESFEDQLTALRLGNDSLVDFHEKWKDVVETVKEYLGSFAQGEDLIKAQANAAEFLSLSLKRIREDFQEELEDGEKQAIQSALKLNDLIEERKKLLEDIVKLQEEFNKAQFELLTADALEKRTAGVVERGNQIVQLRKDFEEAKKEKEDRLAELNTEIAFQTRIVAAQTAIFNLATSTAALKARSNALEESSLDRQLQKFKDIKAIVDGIKLDANGNFTISPDLLAAAGINPGTLSPSYIRSTTITNPIFNIIVPEGTDGEKFGRDMLGSWQNEQYRFGYNNS